MNQRSHRQIFHVLVMLSLFSTTAIAQENVWITCEPRAFHVLPGEPIQVTLTVHADAATPVHVHLPANPLLVLCAVERLPMQRDSEGKMIHQRVAIWQAVEPGMTTMKDISVEAQGHKFLFPEITITVSDPGK